MYSPWGCVIGAGGFGPIDPGWLARTGDPLGSQTRVRHERAQERMSLDGLLDGAAGTARARGGPENRSSTGNVVG